MSICQLCTAHGVIINALIQVRHLSFSTGTFMIMIQISHALCEYNNENRPSRLTSYPLLHVIYLLARFAAYWTSHYKMSNHLRTVVVNTCSSGMKSFITGLDSRIEIQT